MKIKRFFLEKITLYLLGATFFVAFSLLLFWGVNVSSQSEKLMKDNDIPEKEQNTSKPKRDGIQEFIDVLESNDKRTPSDSKINAIKRLGDARVKRAIPLLIKYLDYEDEVAFERSKPKTINGITIITEENDLYLSGRYPVVGALIQIGKPALPELVKVIEKEEPTSIESQNALFVIQQIFIEDSLKGVLFLEEASSKSKSINGSERLQMAAKKTRELLEKVSNNKPVN